MNISSYGFKSRPGYKTGDNLKNISRFVFYLFNFFALKNIGVNLHNKNKDKLYKILEKREEQDNIGAQELLMPTIQSSDIWTNIKTNS